MKYSILSKPPAYNVAKIFREGYNHIDVGGDRSSLSFGDRGLVGAIVKAWNLPKYLDRVAAWRSARRAGRPWARMRDGYAIAREPKIAGLTEALQVCDDKIALYLRHLAGETAPGEISDPEAYERETAKTRHEPLKHAPYLYDPAAARTLTRLFLAPELYLTAADYLGVMPVLGGIRILYSPNEASDDLTYSQLFHIDPEGARQVKVFMAIREVGPRNSPLTFVPEAATRRLVRSGEPVYLRRRVLDKAIQKRVPRSQWVSHEGVRGDTLFVDTSRCFHYGSRPNAEPRFLLYGQYLDPFCSLFPASKPGGDTAKRHKVYETDDRFEQYLLGRR